MRIMVSGGAGFIGSHIVEAVVAAGHTCVVVDSLEPDAHGDDVPHAVDGAEHHRLDVRDASTWTTLLDGVDAVCHQAARVGLGVDFSDVRSYVDHNDAGTAAMLWSMHTVGFAGRIVLASSMVVYGEGGYHCRNHGTVRASGRDETDLVLGRFEPLCPACQGPLAWTPVQEDAPTDPRNVYAATKLHQEHLCQAFGREHGTPVTALRYHNVYGPRMPRDTPYAGVASLFRSSLARGEPPLVFEDGGQTRDFVHVDDVAWANVLALTTPDPYDGPLNVASGRPCTIGAMAAAIASADPAGIEPVITGRYRLGDVRHIVADPARARAAIGFEAAVDPTRGLAEFATAPLRGDAVPGPLRADVPTRTTHRA